MGLFDRKNFGFKKIFARKSESKKGVSGPENHAADTPETEKKADTVSSETEAKIKTDSRLSVPESSALYQLWFKCPECSKGKKFDPLEFMREKIEVTHKELKENFYRINSENALFDDFDENQKEIKEFLKYLDEYAGNILRDSGFDCGITDEQIEKSRNPEFDETDGGADVRLKNNLINDSSIASMGGFKSTEEVKKIIGSSFSEGKEEGAGQNDSLSDTENEQPKVSFDDRDADIQFRLSADKVHAWVFIFPPGKNGKGVSVSRLSEILAENGVIYGADSAMNERIVKEGLFFKLVEIARGSYPVNGTNGKVRELKSRETNKIQLVEDEHGRVNNKELGLITSVHSGDVLAEIDLPTEASDGVRVTGEVIEGVDGKYPKVPAGTNTKLSEDQKTLLADADGELYFRDGTFNVRKVLKINHDVDLSVGNIDYAGDLIINGDVREGFSVKCEGNLKINGLSESAEIIAGGDIYIEKGMFGGSGGSISSGGNLNCKYLENCRVEIKGNLRADQILRCTVTADGLVDVCGSKGRIIGGNISGGKGIRANFIGTQSGMGSHVVLTAGMVSVYMKQRAEKVADLNEIDENISKLVKNIGFLEVKKESLNQVQMALLEKLELHLRARRHQRDTVYSEIVELDQKCRSSSAGVEIKCGQLRSAVDINYDGFKYSTDKELNNFRVFKNGPKIIARANGFEKVITDKA